MNDIKKYGAYLAVLLAGLFLGYLFFSESEAEKQSLEVSAQEQQYTCAMHPQIQTNQKGSCPICGMELSSSDVASSDLKDGQFQMTENAIALANIETTQIGIENLDQGALKLSGKITSNEKTNSIQTTDFDGRIEQLNINSVGQYIKKGRKLGTIYAPDLYAAQDQLLTSVSYKETHEKLFAAARNNSGLWKLTDAQIEQVIRTKKPISRFPITATVNGTVTEVMAAQGNYYKEGDPLFKVSNLYNVWAVFDAYENQLPLLKVGQKVKINSSAFNGQTYTAKIAFIDPVLDANKRTVSLRATLRNKEGLLKPGMFIEGSIETAASNQILTVPKSAVLWTGKRSIVYLKPDPNRSVFEMVEVNLGNAIGSSYSVLEGLSRGDVVVTNGTFTVDAAAQLAGEKSMMQSEKQTPIHDGTSQLGNDEINEDFTMLVLLYDELKNALVQSNGTKANSDAKQLKSQLMAIDTKMLDASLTSHIDELNKQIGIMASTQELKVLRAAFKPLSESMIALASGFSEFDEPIYIQHCPMADQGKGGNWLSFQEEIRNPYYGDAMLTCGSVTKTMQ